MSFISFTAAMDRAKKMMKSVLYFFIGGACLMWVGWWFASPDIKKNLKFVDKVNKNIHSTFFHTDAHNGSIFLFQSVPVLAITIFSYGVIILKRIHREGAEGRTERKEEEKKKIPRLRFGTHPLWVRSPLGVLTGADVLFIVGVLFIVSYHLGRSIYLSFQYIDEHYEANPEDFLNSKVISKVGKAGYHLGQVSMVTFPLLWIPVSRGSPILRLIGVSFEHAVKYHIWLAVLTLLLLLSHGVCYTVHYVAAHKVHEMFEWETKGEACAVVAGVVALMAGLVMWITSLSYFRRKCYEVFFAVHHLYIVFLLFWLYHVQWTIHSISAPVLLFVVDRFLRFLQTRHSVDILSAKIMESGALELSLATHGNRYGNHPEALKPIYHALSSWFVKIPSLPGFMGQQWHLFSVMSSPKDEKPELSIVIKPQGGWTNGLRDQLVRAARRKPGDNHSRCPFSFKAAVEGPYGDDSGFYLKYKSLVLIAGGIGVTPVIAILRDILHRYRLQKVQREERGGTCNNLPTSIQVYHCVRTVEELCVLNSVDPHEILLNHDDLGLNIQVHAYVTSGDREPSASLEISRLDIHSAQAAVAAFDLFDGFRMAPIPYESKQFPTEELLSPVADQFTAEGIPPISPTGQTMWGAAVTLASIVGYYVVWGLTSVFWIRHNDKFPNYIRVHLILISMILGTSVFGGLVIVLWYKLSGSRRATSGPKITSTGSPNSTVQDLHADIGINDEERDIGTHDPSTPWNCTPQFGCRPSWRDVFGELAKNHHGENVGVLVSGPENMQKDVAHACNEQTKIRQIELEDWRGR